MRDAVRRIRRAIAGGERILVFGDYDADGVLSVVMLVKALQALGANVDSFIPERLKDGYGIKEAHLQIIPERGSRLIISVDCGIKANGFVRGAKSLGADVIITDHHRPGDDLPPAEAVLNPLLPGSGYPDKTLAGVGVVYKLIQALFEGTEKSVHLPHYLKLVSIGTIADVAELRGENRLLVKFGLKSLEDISNPGLKCLVETCGLKKKSVSEADVGFRIGPRINAAGRMETADLALRLFLSESLEECRSIARRLDELNSKRQVIEERTFNQAVKSITERSLASRYKLLILGCEDWHRGVIGIVASKLKDAYHRPVILFAYEDGKAHGSGRSISEFALINCLEKCRDLFLNYGGHMLAVGCTLLTENLPTFKQAVNELATAGLSAEDLKRKLRIDTRLDFSDIDQRFVEHFALLSPYGVGNPRPVFLTERAEVVSEPQKIQGRHLKFMARQNSRILEALAWERADWSDVLDRGDVVDLAYSLQFSEYLGEEKFSLVLEDLRKR
jgi:single-stranded-DNA-specific exonuclease